MLYCYMPDLYGKKLYEVDQYEIEKLFGQVYVIEGNFVYVTPKTGDGKKDIIAIDLDGTLKYIESKKIKPKHYIHPNQVWKTCNRVDEYVNEIYGEENYEIHFVTTSADRPSVLNKVIEKYDVEFFSCGTIVNRIRKLDAEYLIDLYLDEYYEIDTKSGLRCRFDAQDIGYTDNLIQYIVDSEHNIELVTYMEHSCKRGNNMKLENCKFVEEFKKNFNL